MEVSSSGDNRKAACSMSFLFIASEDEPAGIPDDYFLLRALTQHHISYQYRLWTDMTDDESTHNQHKDHKQLLIVRSLWEGRTRQGSSPNLLQFFSQTAKKCPQMHHDYILLDWTAHKSYLLLLQSAGVSIVPTCIVLSSNLDKRVNTHTYPHIDPVESSPGGIKRVMSRYGWQEAILKPAVGTRGEGVMRLSLAKWSLAMAFSVASLLKDGDCVLQPFLPPVQMCNKSEICDRIIDSTYNLSPPQQDSSLLGEVCVICINGQISHAVHKNPCLWGWHEPSCQCSGSVLALEETAAICTCKSTAVQSMPSCCTQQGATSISLTPARILSDTDSFPVEVANLLKRAPVEAVALPLPLEIVSSVHKVLDIIRAKSYGRAPYMCRLDFLPRIRTSIPDTYVGVKSTIEGEVGEGEGMIEWLFSEMEGHWCEGFFRAAPESAMELFINAAAASTAAYH